MEIKLLIPDPEREGEPIKLGSPEHTDSDELKCDASDHGQSHAVVLVTHEPVDSVTCTRTQFPQRAAPPGRAPGVPWINCCWNRPISNPPKPAAAASGSRRPKRPGTPRWYRGPPCLDDPAVSGNVHERLPPLARSWGAFHRLARSLALYFRRRRRRENRCEHFHGRVHGKQPILALRRAHEDRARAIVADDRITRIFFPVDQVA